MRQHPLGGAVEDVASGVSDALQSGGEHRIGGQCANPVENIGLAASAPPDGLILVDFFRPIASVRISC